MDRSTLLSIIRTHRADSLGVEDGQLSIDRAKALDHYHGRPYGNEVEGRSQVVSRDLSEAVDWCLPAIMKVFTQSGRLAEFDPVGPEDEELAAQESDYVNQVLMKDNPGFMVLHDAIKDTLLLRNGYVKHWWEVEEKNEEKDYTGISLDEIQSTLTDLGANAGKVEIIGQDSYSVPIPGMPPAMTDASGIMVPTTMELFDLKVKVTKKCGRLIWMAVPTEEVRVSKKCRGSLQDSPFTEHVTKKTRSDLIELGMPVDFVNTLASFNETDSNSTQSFARDSVDDESDTSGASSGDRSMDEIQYCEAYIKIDYDGDGIAELRRVVTVGDQLPPGDEWNEPIAAVPMTGFVAKRVPHRHVGESLDDELQDLQEIMTVLKRQLLDNIYRINNAEMAINENANLRDFMTSTPGGIKRIKGVEAVGNAFQPIITAPIIDKLMPVIAFFDDSKETRTGISKATTGLDPDLLQNTTKGAFMENLNKASQKMEMITRMLAESGVKESVLQVHALLIRHQDQPRTVQLRGKWIPVNPQDWKARTDLTVRVGLGTGSEEEKRNKLQLLAALQSQLMAALVTAPAAVYGKAYTMFADIAKTQGIETPEKYAVAPQSPEYAQVMQQVQAEKQAAAQGGNPDDLAKAAQIQAEANMRVKAAEDQFKRDKAALDAQIKAANDEANRRMEFQLEQMRIRSNEAIATMQQEVQLMLKSVRNADLGAPGISAGVQGSPGVDPSMVQTPPSQPTGPSGIQP